MGAHVPVRWEATAPVSHVSNGGCWECLQARFTASKGRGQSVLVSVSELLLVTQRDTVAIHKRVT